MPITSSDIKRIINAYMQRGHWINISNIQALVQQHYTLTAADWAPHTNSRPTTYPVWKHRIQGVLSNMKKKNMIQHDEVSESYNL
jgi:hypothetical protein